VLEPDVHVEDTHVSKLGATNGTNKTRLEKKYNKGNVAFTIWQISGR